MVTNSSGADQLYLIAERLSKDFSLFPQSKDSSKQIALEGVLDEGRIVEAIAELKKLDIDTYIERTVNPTGSGEKGRPGSQEILKNFGLRIIKENNVGPLYALEAEMDFGDEFRRIGFITQNRNVNNGQWGPEHHNKAVEILREYTQLNIPVVTFMDTPGADALEEANKNNQAHSISALITEFGNVGIPTLGIVLGQGYSGGAIPLATTNLLLSVRDGVFNTIHPIGLESIVRKYNLSWQECAKYVGVSSYELYQKGYLDGIIDYAPGEKGDTFTNLKKAIVSGIRSIENATIEFVANNKYIFEHSRKSIFRFINPSEEQKRLQEVSHLSLSSIPSQQNNVFGVANRYLRYLNLRKKIQSRRVETYGRLAPQQAPKGDLDERTEKDRRAAFFNWLQDPDKIIYDDILNKSWKTFVARREDRFEEYNRFTKLFKGDPQRNYDKSIEDLKFNYAFYLYNLWKSDAKTDFLSLIQYLENYDEEKYLFQNKEINKVKELCQMVQDDSNQFGNYLKNKFSYETKRVINLFLLDKTSIENVKYSFAMEFNTLIINTSIYDEELFKDIVFSDSLKELISNEENLKKISVNRKLLESILGDKIVKSSLSHSTNSETDKTILDVLVDDDLREEFIKECQNVLIFDGIYNNIVTNLVSIAKEANAYKILSKESVRNLLDTALQTVTHDFMENHLDDQNDKNSLNSLREQFYNWLIFFIHHSKCGEYLTSVELWKKLVFPRLSDTLLVIITFFFERILPEYYLSEKEGKIYEGRINPKSIGRKDFWNRITIAYNDLLIQEILTAEKKKKLTSANSFIETFFTDFKYHSDNNLMSANPVSFPGFRIAIEKALKNNVTPCGIITGIGRFKSDKVPHRVGVIISNIDFQAGAFDMASAEKVCKLLVDCAIRRLPVVCFISSGGMQTKEGAGALFSMPIINDRITRFVRDNDLPIIVFGFGDCTGGAQASFVTHPCVQTYYFSGTNMPFAGQIVVRSYLPSIATLSNYLSQKEGAMRGLVKNPFSDDLDERLQEVDPNMPVPKETVEDVFVRIMKGSLLTTEDDELKQNEISNIRPIQRVLIHARGCTAVKLIRKAQENDIQVVLVQSDPDMNSVAADMITGNDHLICIGGNTPDESYLNAKSVLKIAEHEEADALHPGIGFLSENSEFAEYCRNHQINFIGPSVYSMEMMGNKSNAINTSLKLNIPVVPGSHGVLTSSDLAASVADKISYPVMIKAVHGGGGKGIQVVEKPEDIHQIFHQLCAEAKSAFGNGDVYLEKYITSLRHIEIQLLRDSNGNTKILGLRDCSVQRNNQKLIEESSSTMLPDELMQKAFKYTEDIANEINYIGAGTVEFIFDLPSKSLYFMEMNTRLQVEHPVTEAVSGVDIVTSQFKIASGESIESIVVNNNGYAMEVRVNAEKMKVSDDNSIQFLPNPGEVTEFMMPDEEYIEIISTIAQGKFVSPYYDSMVVQIICHGDNREDTINKLLNYLDRVTIKGICTNIPLIKRILKDSVFREGDYDTGYLPKFLSNVNSKELVSEIEEYAGVSEQKFDIASLTISESNELKVISPSTGIFYLTPSPTEPEFVKLGDKITIDHKICLIEAMKLFTSVTLANFNGESDVIYEANQEYEVTRINKSTGQQVNAGDLLFVIKAVGQVQPSPKTQEAIN
ncbi:MAG: carbamoyl-phosphate synthase large subunit [Planctomycetota bacterium]|nr:MAG: carbamoyl-phosphate synthase large subunit [Planctomycetota bacterium]